MNSKEHTILDWEFKSNKKPISNSESIDKMSDKNNLTKIPDSIFGENYIIVENKSTEFKLLINAEEALKFCKYEFLDKHLIQINEKNYNNYDYKNSITYRPKLYKVNLNQANIDANEEEADMDWTYSSLFKGYLEINKYKYEFNPNVTIPLERLGIENPIIFYDDVYFYEDDWGDFGYTQFRCRYRVMKDCAFFLLRSYIRIDNVVIRLIDTRYFIDFIDDKIIRDFTIKEDNYNNLKNKLNINSEFIWNQNQSDLVYDKLPIIHKTIELFTLK